ncbi:MAG: hypothetical protein OXF02_06330 [Simkaniaceae bacterium]|nr:hypothetical protein [Simkaniaceae bacterium]
MTGWWREWINLKGLVIKSERPRRVVVEIVRLLYIAIGITVGVLMSFGMYYRIQERIDGLQSMIKQVNDKTCNLTF